MTTDIATLVARKAEIKAELATINAALKEAGHTKTGKRGRVAGGVSLSSALVNLLKERGALSASDIITALSGTPEGCKETSVRTLLSTMNKAGKIAREGTRGTYLYSAPVEG